MVNGYGWFVHRGLWNSQSGAYIHDNHTKLVKDALKVPGWNRLLFLEDDHEFADDMLYKHAHYTQPVVSGLYVLRSVDNPMPVFFEWDTGRHNAVHPSKERMKCMLENRGLHEVDVVPMGCTSIRRDVLENWPAEVPMFFSPINPANGATMSDDVWFCRKAQEQGYQIYVDTSNRVAHYALFPLDDTYFIRWNNYHAPSLQRQAEELMREEED